MHESVAPAARHGPTALHRATTGVRGPEPLPEPLDGLVQIRSQVANVLNLVKHRLSFACRVYGANVRCPPHALTCQWPHFVRRIIDPFALLPKPPQPYLLRLPRLYSVDHSAIVGESSTNIAQ